MFKSRVLKSVPFPDLNRMSFFFYATIQYFNNVKCSVKFNFKSIKEIFVDYIILSSASASLTAPITCKYYS